MDCPTKAQGLTITLAYAVFAASLSFFSGGYLNVVLNVPQTVFVSWIRWVECERLNSNSNSNSTKDATDYVLWCGTVTPDQEVFILRDNLKLNTIWVFVNSIVAVGTLLSVCSCTFLAGYLGLKGTMYVACGMIVLGAVLSVAAGAVHVYELLMVGRLLCGFAHGLTGVVSPVYLSEITPARFRGAVGTLPVIMLILGMLTANLLGLPIILGNNSKWPILMAMQTVPVVLIFIFLPFCPNSPRRLLMLNGDKARAMKALMWLRRTPDVQEELASLQKEFARGGPNRVDLKFLRIFQEPFLRSVLTLCLVPMFAKQLSGFMCIMYFSTSILTEIGLDPLYSAYATIGMWMVNLFFTLVSMALIDRVGRKSLLIVSQTGVMVALSLFTLFMVLSGRYQLKWATYWCAGSAILYMMAYSVGCGSVPFVLPAELFPREALTAAVTLISVLGTAAGLFTTLLFPLAVMLLQEYTFLLFVGSVALCTVYVAWKLPETKGKTFDEIQTLLQNRLK